MVTFKHIDGHGAMGLGGLFTGIIVFFKKHIRQPVIGRAGAVFEVEKPFQVDDSFTADKNLMNDCSCDTFIRKGKMLTKYSSFAR